VCVECDELIFRISKSRTLNLKELPPRFFTVLLKPTGKEGEAPVLHHKLVSQYDVSRHFPGDWRFKHLLLSPRGLLMHVDDCQQKSDCCCSPQQYLCGLGLFISATSGQMSQVCHSARKLDRSVTSPSKLHGLWDLGFIAYSVIWTHDFTSSTSPTCGTRLTGHLYSTRLNTTLVRQRNPLEPRDAPVKVFLVSPFASDKSASARAKIARTKQD
jgi:hypothetical protein